jgi:biopolymer transport protein ExbD
VICVKRNSSLPESPDLTPLIDIVFIVVVFLLLTANTQILSLPIDIADTPEALDPARSEEKSLMLTLSSVEPVWTLTQANELLGQAEPLGSFPNWEALSEQLPSYLGKGYTFQLIPETQAEVDQLVQAMAFFHTQKIQNVEILMSPSK